MVSSSAENYLHLAKNCQERKEIESAIALYEKAIAINPQLFSAYRNLGDIYAENNLWEKAINCYQNAYQLQPQSWLILQKIGNIFLKKEDLITAAIYFQRSININPNFPWSHNNLGIIMEKMGVIEQAIFCYEKVIELHPDFINAYYKLVKIQEKLGGYDNQLISNYQTIIELNPEAWWFYQKLGVLLEKNGQLTEAIALYEKVIVLNPDLVWSYEKLAEISASKSQWQKIIDICQMAYRIHSHNHLIPWYVGNAYKQQGKYEQAFYYLIKSLEIKTNHRLAYQSIADIFEAQGNYQQALNCRNNCQLPKELLMKYCGIDENIITQSVADPHTNYYLIHSEAELLTPASKTINKNIHHSFRKRHFLLPSPYIANIEQARIFWNVGITAIFNKENKLVSDLSKGCAELIVNSPTVPNIEFKFVKEALK